MTRRKTGARRSKRDSVESTLSMEPPPTVAIKTRSHARHGNGTRYSDDDKLRAVTAMYVANRQHPYSEDSLLAARRALGAEVSNSTLRKWIVEVGDKALAVLPQPTDAQIAAATGSTMFDALTGWRDDLLIHARKADTIAGTSTRDTAVSVGIIFDKLEKMTGIPAETQARVKRLSAFCDSVGWSVDTLLDDLLLDAQKKLGLLQPRPSSPLALTSGDSDTVDAT